MPDDLLREQQMRDLDATEPFAVPGEPGLEDRLASLFDRYADALDSGDEDAAEEILGALPAGERFRTPLRGLYLLGRNVRQGQAGPSREDHLQHRRLGDFEIEGELGRGGMGIVYSATESSLQRRVALKVLPFAAVADPRSVARFRNEARAAASLHHPHIVPVHSVGCERGVHYFSMQLVEGQSLERYIASCRENPHSGAGSRSDTLGPKRSAAGRSRPGPQPHAVGETRVASTTAGHCESPGFIHKAIEIGRDVARALAHAHDQGVVHRDIKPSNLLLDHAGKIWVTDFGLARLGDSTGLTSQGDRPGTARYMSPEQAAGRHQQVDFRTDIYSLGVTLYELLALRPAFDAPDRNRLLAAIEAGSTCPLRSINPRAPVDLETVIAKAMASDPAERYGSASALADDLDRCLKGEPVHARRPTLADRAVRKVRKHLPAFVGVAAALLVIAVVAAVAASVFLAQRQQAIAKGDQARLFLGQAQRVVDRFGGLLAAELEQFPGAESVRAQLLDEAIRYHRGFVEYSADDPQLNVERGMALSRLAGLCLQCDREAEAAQACQAAIPLLAVKNGDDAAARGCLAELAACHCRLGTLELRAGRLEKARLSFDDALKVVAAPELGSGHAELVSLAAQARGGLAQVAWNQGHHSTALGLMQSAIEPLGSQPGLVPETAEHRSLLFQLEGLQAGWLAEHSPDEALGALERSLKSLEAATAILESRLEELSSKTAQDMFGAPTAQLRRFIDENGDHAADLRNNLAIVLGRTGRLEQAEKEAELVAGHWRTRLAGRPDSAWLARRLATAENTLGDTACQRRDWPSANKALERAESILRDLAQRHPDDAETLSRLAGVLHNRGVVASETQSQSAAAGLIQEAVQLQRRAIQLAPGQAEFQSRLEAHESALLPFAASSVSGFQVE